jgi:macrolide-specific efflux system membrane fusion protein
LAELKVEQAELDRTQAELVRQLREAELRVAQHEVANHVVTAPYDGVIVELLQQVGDWVQPEQPVLRLIRMDRLKVETFLDAKTIPPHEALGRPVTVTIHMPSGAKRVIDHCRIDYVCPELEPTGEYRAWCEVANARHDLSVAQPQWLLRPGMTAELEISLAPIADEDPEGDRLAKAVDRR